MNTVTYLSESTEKLEVGLVKFKLLPPYTST